MSDPKTRSDWLIAELASPDLTRILDVGASPISNPPYHDLLERKQSRVWGFEPQPDAFAKLTAEKSAFETYYPFAIGDGSQGVFYDYHWGGFSSLFKAHIPSFKYLGKWMQGVSKSREIPVTTTRLDDIADLPSPHLLKIDIQGGELSVFQNAHKTLATTVAIITEVRLLRLYEKEPMFADQMIELQNQGFIFHKFQTFNSTALMTSQSDKLRPRFMRNQAVDADAVFIRDMTQSDELTCDQLCHLAILADAVFASFDLVLRCLDDLENRNAAPSGIAERYLQHLPKNCRR